MQKEKKQRDNVHKATIIVRLKSGQIIHGEGTIEGLKSADGRALITTRFYKEMPKDL